MKHANTTTREQVSALADGDLRDDELAEVVGRMGTDEESREAWRTYHLIGDVMRSGAQAPSSDPSAFLARFRERLAAEPPLQPPAPPAPEVPRARAEAANEPVFRWKLAAAVASLVAAVSVGWNLAGIQDAPAPVPQVVILSDPRLVQLLEAHWQVGGASQMPSEFLRNATYEQYSR
jgi:sigma-E factor negative regulatory protein RseA